MNKVCSPKTHDGQIEEMKRDRCISGINDRAEADTSKSPRGFPKLLHNLLCDMERSRGDHIVSWCPGGTCFKVHDHQAFEARIMPHYFAKNTTFSSFLRQLSLYEFRRCGGKKNPNGPKGAYEHPFFLRDKPEYLSQGLVLRVKDRADGRKSAWNLISQHEQHPEKDPCVSGLGGSLSNSAGGEPSRHISSTRTSPHSSMGAGGQVPRTQRSFTRYVSNISGSSDVAATPFHPESYYYTRPQQGFSSVQRDDMHGYLNAVVVEPLPTPSSTTSSLSGVASPPPVVDDDILHEILKTFGRKKRASSSGLQSVVPASRPKLFDDTPLDAASSNLFF